MALFLQGESRLHQGDDEIMIIGARRNKPMPLQKWICFEMHEGIHAGERGLSSIDLVLNMHFIMQSVDLMMREGVGPALIMPYDIVR